MNTITSFVDRYTALWNETDAEARSKRVRELWTKDGYYANAVEEFHGHEKIADAVLEAHDDFIAKGFAFTTHAYQGNHGAVRITWHMIPVGGSDVVAVGTEFILLNAEGLILTDYQFMDIDPATQ